MGDTTPSAPVAYDPVPAVKRKLNITWSATETDQRVRDVVAQVAPALAFRLGLPAGHAFSPADGEAWSLFLNACLYEFSDALDDFWSNYAGALAAQHYRFLAEAAAEGEGAGDAP